MCDNEGDDEVNSVGQSWRIPSRGRIVVDKKNSH